MNETVKATLMGIEKKGPHVFCKGDGKCYRYVDGSFATGARESKRLRIFTFMIFATALLQIW